ncbi:MAG TPA: NAD(P)/FAD-dependent oxidoreductase [Chitinophagaceae bacterium]|nr:NAD(P)/FAD-dependent oxidoreductase [Chitinophagaceae bacterium]
MEKETVIIAGAGAAGLMAARELIGDYDVIVLEASSRLGGRIWSKPLHDATIVEAGAEFIHGHQAETLKLLKQAGIGYVRTEGRMYHKEKEAWLKQTEMIEGWDELLQNMKKLKTDMTLHDFLHTYFSENKYADLRRNAVHYATGFDLVDVHKASVRSLYNEWSHEEEVTFRIPEGYSALLNFLKEDCEKKGCRILTDQIVKQVDWEKNEVTVSTVGRQEFQGNKFIATLPLSILQKTGHRYSLNFTPPLDEYIKAANDIAMGAVVKVVMLFRQGFWKEDMGFVFSDEMFPTWWTQLPDEKKILTGWAGGPKADQLSDQSDNEILEKAYLSLSSIFNCGLAELKQNTSEAFVFNWQNETLSLHGYSYDTLRTGAARRILNTPANDTLFFAGEALYDGRSPGTVEAAFVSGKEVARKLRRS